MNRLLTRLAACLALTLTLAFAAEPKEKSPGDVAAEAFFKLRDDKEAKLDSDRILKLQKVGLDFLAAYPTHGRANNVVSALANFAGTIRDKKQQALRDYWGSSLNYEIVNRRTKADVTDEARAIFCSLDAAHAGYLARTLTSRDTVETFRAKIDRLAETEGGARYVPAQERDYVRLLLTISAKQAEAHARKLIESSDKRLAAVGREELNLIELARTPLDLKVPTLDGKGFEAAAWRGKVVYFMFWSSTNEASVKELDAQKSEYKRLQKLGVEIVTVAHDTDRAALEKVVKDKGYAWPVLFDGQGAKGQLSEQLGARNLPTGALFNQQGTLVRQAVRVNQLNGELAKLGIKVEK